jgi:hypothetical protein
MGEVLIDQSVDGIIARVADALNRRAGQGAAKFVVSPKVLQEKFGDGRTTMVAGVVRNEAGAATAAIDVYRLDGVHTLRASYEDSGFLVKAALPALVISSYVPRAWRARKRKAKNVRERRQLHYAVAVLLLLTGYLIALAVTAVGTGLNAIDPSILDAIPRRVQAAWGAAVTFATAIGLWKSKALQGLASGAIGYIAVSRYLDQGDRRPNLTGELAALLEHLAERDKPYDRVDVVAFSFGSIVALDAFSPEGSEPGPRFSDIQTLVTIGCPFDFIRAYWPGYFVDRVVAESAPRDWLNVYTPIDILSSNFRDDTEVAQPERGIPTNAKNGRRPFNIFYRSSKKLEDMSACEFWAFTGLSSHSIYWGRRRESETIAFEQIVVKVYAHESIMA